MSDIVIVALISFCATLIGNLINGNIIRYRIEQLENKVEKHNKLADWKIEAQSEINHLKEEIEEMRKAD